MSQRATFPDAPLTPAELRASLRGEPLNTPKTTFCFDESWRRTERVFVEAFDEDEAWRLYEDKTNRFRTVTLYDDECVDVEVSAQEVTS